MTLNGAGVAVIVGVDVEVGVGEEVGVAVTVGVKVEVGVDVGVGVSVKVGVKVGLGVGAGVVGIGVGEDAPESGSPDCNDRQAASNALNPANWRKVRRLKG